MKTLKLHFLFCAITALCVMTACSDDDDNAAGGKQSYTCSVTIKTAVNDTTLINDEVYMAALKKENELLLNKLTNALGLDSLGEFVFQATDTTALKAEVAAKCEAALAGLGDSWKGYHQVWVRHSLNEKNFVKLYKGEFGKSSGANSGIINMGYYSANGISSISFSENVCYFRELGITSGWWRYLPGGFYYHIPCDLNSSAGGEYVYLCGWNDVAEDPITDVICVHTEFHLNNDFTVQYNGRTYKMLKPHAEDYVLDCNYGAGGPYLYLMETRDVYDGYGLCNMEAEAVPSARGNGNNEKNEQTWVRTVPSVDASGNKRNDCADLNEGVGGNYVYLHLKYYKM